MADNKIPKLRKSRTDAFEKILERINIGKELFETQISYTEELDNLKHETNKWIAGNKMLFNTLFDKSPLSSSHGSVFSWSIYKIDILVNETKDHKRHIAKWINDLESVHENLKYCEESPNNTQQPTSQDTMNNQTKYFIGHGRSLEWLKLKDFLENTLKLPYEEFNRIPQAGKTTSNRLKEMLESCCMAFLIMTGEDEHTDGTLHARENVIHEIGLFQAQLGYEKAIILLEEGCEKFSNIQGITYIEFPKGNIRAAFEDIRDVLKRESIIKEESV